MNYMIPANNYLRRLLHLAVITSSTFSSCCILDVPYLKPNFTSQIKFQESENLTLSRIEGIKKVRLSIDEGDRLKDLLEGKLVTSGNNSLRQAHKSYDVYVIDIGDKNNPQNLYFFKSGKIIDCKLSDSEMISVMKIIGGVIERLPEEYAGALPEY